MFSVVPEGVQLPKMGVVDIESEGAAIASLDKFYLLNWLFRHQHAVVFVHVLAVAVTDVLTRNAYINFGSVGDPPRCLSYLFHVNLGVLLQFIKN